MNIGLIGYPVHHSLSPEMQNSAFRELGLNYKYEKFNVEPGKLGDIICYFQANGFKGFNVTIPHKETVMPFLDEIDEEALAIGAVNTVDIKDGKLIGYNTDGKGFVNGLKQKLIKPISESHILILGAGGAARAIAHSLYLHQPMSIVIANRTTRRAEKIIQECLKGDGNALTLQEAEHMLSRFDIVVNTTPIGMHPNYNEIPLDLRRLNEGTVLSDIIYNPLKTKWLKLGEQKGAIIDNGLSMFVHQGALAFEIWTGRKPNVDLMKETVIKQLGGSYVNR